MTTSPRPFAAQAPAAGSRILGTGHHRPERVMTNADLEQLVVGACGHHVDAVAGAPQQHQAQPAQQEQPQQVQPQSVRGTVPLAPQQPQQTEQRRQQDLPTVVEPDLGAGSSDLDVPDFLK